MIYLSRAPLRLWYFYETISTLNCRCTNFHFYSLCKGRVHNITLTHQCTASYREPLRHLTQTFSTFYILHDSTPLLFSFGREEVLSTASTGTLTPTAPLMKSSTSSTEFPPRILSRGSPSSTTPPGSAACGTFSASWPCCRSFLGAWPSCPSPWTWMATCRTREAWFMLDG